MNFYEFIADLGYQPPNIIPGEIIRFPAIGKPNSNRSAWAMLFIDGQAGVVGDWITGEKYNWFAESENLSKQDKNKMIARIVEIQAKAEIERSKQGETASNEAFNIWQQSEPVKLPCNHLYVVNKSIDPWGARLHGKHLIIPVYEMFKKLVSLQSIAPNGFKKFLKGGKTKDCFCVIHHLDISQHFNDVFKQVEILICEGWATGCSLYQAIGRPVFVAFNANNLMGVAKYVRAQFPKKQIIVCADNDQFTAGNPGLTKAKQAADGINALWVYPDFTDFGNPTSATDFNDYFNLGGEAWAL